MYMPAGNTEVWTAMVSVPVARVIVVCEKYISLYMTPVQSSLTSERNVGAAAAPVVGPAKIKLALCVASVVVRVPDVVTGLPLTLNMAGIDKATLVTVPLPGPMFVMVIPPAALVIWMPEPAVRVAAATDEPVEPM